MSYDRKRYDEALQKAANQSFNGDLIKSRMMTKRLQAKWPDLEFGYFNESDYPLRISDDGGAWIGLTADKWREFGEEWNDAVAMRHGVVERNGVLMMPPGHIICWRPRWFGQKLKQISNEKVEERLAGNIAASQAATVDASVGRKVTTAKIEEDYEPAKMAPDAVVSDPEFVAAHQPKLQVSVPSNYKKPAGRKPGRKPKPAAKVDKATETP